MNFLQEAGVHVLPWPPCSRDLNPLEHMLKETIQFAQSSTDSSGVNPRTLSCLE